MMRPVLIVIDMLHDFLKDWEPDRKERLVQSINELVNLTRRFCHPVVWVRQEFEPDLRDAFPEMRAKGIRITIKGTQGCKILSELALVPSDVVVIKKRYSAFYGTTLDETLARLKPDSIILAGINTHACIPPQRLTHTSETGLLSWPPTVLTRTIRNIRKSLLPT